MKPGDLVCLYGVGSTSTASAALVRWTEPALGPLPEGPATVSDGVDRSRRRYRRPALRH